MHATHRYTRTHAVVHFLAYCFFCTHYTTTTQIGRKIRKTDILKIHCQYKRTHKRQLTIDSACKRRIDVGPPLPALLHALMGDDSNSTQFPCTFISYQLELQISQGICFCVEQNLSVARAFVFWTDPFQIHGCPAFHLFNANSTDTDPRATASYLGQYCFRCQYQGMLGISGLRTARISDGR